MTTTSPFEGPAALAFRTSRQAAIILVPDGSLWTIVDVNDAYLAATGRARADLVGQSLSDAFPESADTGDEHGWRRVAASLADAMHKDARVVLPVQRYDLPDSNSAGAFVEHHWEMSSVPLRDRTGAFTGVLHEVENVTARELANRERQRLAADLEDRVRELEAAHRATAAAERQLRTVFTQAPAAVGVTAGPEHRFTLVNRGYEVLVGREVNVGQTFREALPEIAAQGFESLLDEVFRTGIPYAAREAPAMLDKGGAAREPGWYNFVYQPLIDADGRVTGILQQAIDVTQHVRARQEAEAANTMLHEQTVELEAQTEELQSVAAQLEERTAESERAATELAEHQQQLRTLADAIPTLAWTARADGFIDWYNARWYEYTGTTPEQMLGWGWASVHDASTLPVVAERWSSSIATGTPFEMTFPLRSATGEFRNFLTRVSPLTSDDGRVLRWFGTNTDVQLEYAAREAAEYANRAKSEFLTAMSHELRTPLNAIAGYTELLEMGIHGPVTDVQRDVLGRIQRSQRHLLGLINDILNFAKIEAGRIEYHVDDVPVRDAVDALEPLIAPQLLAKSLAFDRSGCAGDERVQADPEKLQQILLNLLSNAIKFTPASGRITVACVGRGERTLVSVEDTGIGIPADRLEDVFAPFIQVSRRLNAPHEGTGLGLAISRDLARAMGGDLTVESAVDVGSRFLLSLPSSFSPSSVSASGPLLA
ncbi:MAG: PAS domain-containing protein [Gemmatimonadota bacterium]|nr:PAS domain-containing protein [Gemmatimonadota bacterium]